MGDNMTDREYLTKLMENLERVPEYEEISWTINSFIKYGDEDIPSFEMLDIGGIISENGEEFLVEYNKSKGLLEYKKFGQEWREM